MLYTIGCTTAHSCICYSTLSIDRICASVVCYVVAWYMHAQCNEYVLNNMIISCVSWRCSYSGSNRFEVWNYISSALLNQTFLNHLRKCSLMLTLHLIWKLRIVELRGFTWGFNILSPSHHHHIVTYIHPHHFMHRNSYISIFITEHVTNLDKPFAWGSQRPHVILEALSASCRNRGTFVQIAI